MNRTRIALIAGLALAALGYLSATPYIAAHRMLTAVTDGDAETLSEYIDFPALRQSFKDQLNAAMLDAAKDESNPFGALGALLGGAIVERVIDAYVTPAGIMTMMKGKKLDISGEIDGMDLLQPSDETDLSYALSYESWNRFSIAFTNNESKAEEEVKLILRRQGLTDWKLTGIERSF